MAESDSRNAGGDRRRRVVLLSVIMSAALALAGRVFPAGAQNGPEPTPLPAYALPDPRLNPVTSSNTMALARDALTMAAVNMLSDTVTILRPHQSLITVELPVGRDPRSVAFTPDGTQAVVANRGDSTLTVIGVSDQATLATIPLGGNAPYGVVVGSRGLAYVSLLESDEIAVVDLNRREVRQRIAVEDAPAGLALWGDFLYVTHFWSGEVSLIYLPQARPIMVVSTGLDTGLSQGITIDPAQGVAYLPQTRFNSLNPDLTFDTVVFPVVNRLDLRDLSLQRQARITLDTADQPVNMPFSAALDRTRRRLYVANAGSNDVSIINLDTGMASGHLEVGANPRGILLNADGSLLYVHNVLDASITIVDTAQLTVLDVLPITSLNIPTDLYLGAQLFHSADDPRMAADGWLSCATCHFDGQSDGRVWAGFPGGPRNTPALYDLPETAPYTWTGQWDELADVEVKIRTLLAGHGLVEGLAPPAESAPNLGSSPDLETLITYLVSIPSPQPNPPEDMATVQRGREVFEAEGCGSCHVGSIGTDLDRHDVGTARSPLETTTAFDTPTLRWLRLSAPYFHDGAAATLRDVFTLPGEHQLIYEVAPEDIDALAAFLLAWPRETIP